MIEATQSPTSNSGGGWLDPENAYSSNDAYAVCGRRGEVRRYFDYDFDGVLPASISISKVEVGLEFYCQANENLKIRVSVDGGVSWSAWSDIFTLTTESMLWVDVTAYIAWIRDYFLNVNWKVEVAFGLGGGGACPEKIAWSAYLDWIPTKVTYEEVAPPEKRVFGDGLFWRKS